MPKMIMDKQIKRGDRYSFFVVVQWLANGWIIGHCCFYHLLLKERMTYYQFRGEKRVQRLKSLLPCPKVVNRYYSDMGDVDLMDQCSIAYCQDRKSSHMSIVTSFITWSILTTCLSLITRLLSQKTYFNTIKTGKGQYQCRDHLRKNQPELIDNHGGYLPDYQTMGKQCA